MKSLLRGVVVSALLALGVALIVPIGSAQAAQDGGWASYLWKKSGTCLHDNPDNARDVARLRVRRTSLTSAATRTSDGVLNTFRATRDGRMFNAMYAQEADPGLGIEVAVKSMYPTVAQARARRTGGWARLVMKVTFPKGESSALAAKGRTIILAASYRYRGLGEKRLTLPGGPVKAVGLSVIMSDFSMANVRPEMRATVRTLFRPLLAGMGGDEWWAKGRGQVRVSDSSGEDRSTYIQRRCA